MDRREFPQAGVYGATLFTASGLIPAVSRQARAATVNMHLTAAAATKTLIDGSTTTVWQFTGDAGAVGPGALGAGLVLQAGDDVTLTLSNNLPQAINLLIPGVLSNTSTCAPGSSASYAFTAPAAGTYFLCDGLSGELGRAMQLFAPLVVLPANGANILTPGDNPFDQQYTLVLSELDTRLNDAIAAGQTYDLAAYEPNYFFVNGLSYPDTVSNLQTAVAMQVGQTIALRFVNCGLIYQPMHFHGYHVQVKNRNRVAEISVVDKDSVAIQPAACVDLLLPVTQPGMYHIHSHFLPAVTANGVYPNGALIAMTAV